MTFKTLPLAPQLPNRTFILMLAAVVSLLYKIKVLIIEKKKQIYIYYINRISPPEFPLSFLQITIFIYVFSWL